MNRALPMPDEQPLCPRRHRTLRLVDSEAVFGYTRQRQWLPLTLAELPHACLDYPCLFQPTAEGFRLVALLGLRSGENLFVDTAGRWADGCWLPAVAAMHPFSLADAGSGAAALRVDDASPRLSAVHGRRLFDDDGLPLPLLHDQLALLMECRDELRRAGALAARLAALGLLVPRPVHFDNGRLQGQVEGLWQVDEQRLAALPPTQLPSLHASGDLASVHAHLLSKHQLPRLAHRLAATLRRATAPAPWSGAAAARGRSFSLHRHPSLAA
jgi:hypothetical protein